MRPSPLQLQRVIFNRVSILPHAAQERAISAAGFDFDGVGIRSDIGVGQKQGQADDPRDFLVKLQVTIDNKEGKVAPYTIDVEVLGLFNVSGSLPKERREDLLTVNGASILYGAIREMVLSLTSRFAAGGLTLPGVNFEDDAPSVRGTKVADKQLGRARKTRAVRSRTKS